MTNVVIASKTVHFKNLSVPSPDFDQTTLSPTQLTSETFNISDNSMPLLPWEETISCPYNPSHQITQKIIQKHLVKCRRNHPDTDLVICSFNSTHHIPGKIIKKHEEECPDRKLFEQIMYIPENQMRAPTPVTSQPTCGSDNEDWEAEANVKVSYDPAEAAARKNVVRKIEGANPSQRKAFRMKEFERLKNLERKDDTNESSDNNEEEETPDLKFNVVRGKGKGILLVKLRKMRNPPQSQDVGGNREPSSSAAKNNNNMKRRGVELEQDLERSEFAPVSAKRVISKGRGRIKWESRV